VGRCARVKAIPTRAGSNKKNGDRKSKKGSNFTEKGATNARPRQESDMQVVFAQEPVWKAYEKAWSLHLCISMCLELVFRSRIKTSSITLRLRNRSDIEPAPPQVCDGNSKELGEYYTHVTFMLSYVYILLAVLLMLILEAKRTQLKSTQCKAGENILVAPKCN